jgi:membrane protease YdiL (CAAX protease family)
MGAFVKRWNLLALVLATVVVPGLVIGFRLAGRPGGNAGAVVVELGMFAVTALAVWIARVKEGRSWASLGLAPPRLRQTVGLTLLGLAGVGAVLAACLGLFHALGWRFGEGDGVERPMWLLALMITRAGTVEELTYRSIAIDHTADLTGSKTLGWLLPGLLFGALHYAQGLPGVIIATATGFAITALYLWKRNLWANFAIHFLVDFVPNILLPLLGVLDA